MNEEFLLKECFKNALREADETLGAKTISFPPVSSGIFKFPVDKCAKIFYGTVVEYIQEHKRIGIREIRVVLSEPKNVGAFPERRRFHMVYLY